MDGASAYNVPLRLRREGEGMRIVVIGAGIVGACVAYRLAEAGAEVTVLEARRPGGGTSTTSYAWVNACEKTEPRSYFDLNFAGMKAHAELVDELAGDWYERPGILQWEGAGAEAGGPDRDRAEEKLRMLTQRGYAAALLTPAELAELEPEINPRVVGDAPILHYPEDGWVQPLLLIGAVLGVAARRHGVAIRYASPVADLVVAGGACRGVRLADGSTVDADFIVNCAGRWVNEAVAEQSVHVPLAPTFGLAAYTVPAGVALRRGLRTPLVNMRPDGAGRFLLRSNDLDRLVTSMKGAGPAHPQARELLQRARATIPVLADVELEAARIAIRPIPKDGLSALGPIPGLANYYVTVTHSGVTLAPFIALAATDEIVHGSTRLELIDFRPARFF
jgi:glycine/D-amino acid oxidase-like deaminating enzyme